MVMSRKTLLPVLAQIVVTTLIIWVAFRWTGARNHLLYVWPVTAVQLSIALVNWNTRRSRLLQLAACAVGQAIASSLLALPAGFAAAMIVLQTAEVGCAAALIAPRVRRFDDLKRSTSLRRFLLASLVVPLSMVSLAAEPISLLTRQPWLQTWKVVAPSDVLGYVILVPPLLFLLSGEYRSLRKLRPHLATGVPALLLLATVCGLTLFRSSVPFLFLLFPFLLIVLFLLGLEGGVFSALLITVLASWVTARHQGPIWIMPDPTEERATLMLQLFLATVAAVALPVGALLDERRQAERSILEGQSIYRTLLENTDDMIVLSSLEGSRRFVSPAVAALTGWTSSEYLALGQFGGIHPKDHDHVQTMLDSLSGGKMNHALRYRALCRDGSYRWVEATVKGYTGDGQPAGYVATVRDISTQLESEKAWVAERAALSRENRQLAELASRDELTGLPNRRTFNRTLESEAARQSRSPLPLSMMMVDVDHFKKYNDLYGHQAGDVCLQRIAQCLSEKVGRASDVVARIGGEEFAVLLPGTDEAGVLRVGEIMLEAVRDLQFEHSGTSLGLISISIGVALWPPSYRGDPAQLIQLADRALYESKRLGRNRLTMSEISASL